MSDHQTYPVIIAGGGPVGLYLALRLIQSGIKCLVLEQKPEIDKHSKSLGVHPVSLELFDELNIANRFIEKGTKIYKGHAFADDSLIGTISFEDCPPPFNFILTLPQNMTEQILQDELQNEDPECLQRGIELVDFDQTGQSVHLTCRKEKEILQYQTEWLIGCDGKNSIVRKKAGLTFEGKQYPDTYIMGDFKDCTSFGSDAAVYLHRDGLVESFPLPDGQRRWVLKTDHYIENPNHPLLANLLKNRISIDISRNPMHMIGSFGVQHLLANTLNSGRILLAGDSAHVVSPIGGQGMNLGWISAGFLFQALHQIHHKNRNAEQILQSYTDVARRIARQVAIRAEINMRLGRKQNLPVLRQLMIRVLVNSPLKKTLAKVFTMRGLGKWWF
jgi:2-polyprenyl-6-methoxyphenol hydroxylase-like FAD-dependent oxidoreductase